MRYLLGIIIVGLMVGLGIRVFQLEHEKNNPKSKRNAALAVSVKVGVVEKGPVRDIGRFNGSLEAKYRFLVAPKITGRLVHLAVNAGEKIEPGQLIAKLDDDELVLAVEEATATLAVAEATQAQSTTSVELSQREYDRQFSLHQSGVATVQRLDEAKTDLEIKKALHRLNQAQIVRQKASLDAARVRLGYATIRAEWDTSNGSSVRYIGERYTDEGALLRANDPICSIIDTDLLTAVLDVPERLYPRLTAGMAVSIRVGAYPGEVFAGVLRVRPAELSAASRQAQVEVEVANHDQRLAPGMFAQAEVVFDERDDVPRLPVAALVRRDEKQGVYIVEERTGEASGEVRFESASATTKSESGYQARFIQVVPGIIEGDWMEIKSPEITAPVVLLGQHRLIDNTPLELDDEARALMVSRTLPSPGAEDTEKPATGEAGNS